ncbi:MAG TPA: TIGR02678 family protein [Acidimicrobiales bacterium]|nr:TIGR02678 family protein [Acidimicrobiales bacterium]
MADDPQAAVERRMAARALLATPLLCKELVPDTFALIRRHEAELDRWMTTRLGYRLEVTADTARLAKTGYVPVGRAPRTAGGRPLHQLEMVLLVLVLASVIAGPAVISLRDLVDRVRSAAVDAGIELAGDAAERRALVTALKFMIERGLATEILSQVDGFATDADADAVLRIRPDRIAMLPLPALASSDLLAAASVRAEAPRQHLRARLVEDPVLYRDDCSDDEWGELRRRLGEEARYLDEMFGFVVEARSEGIAAIDPTGSLSDRPFPAGGTEGHAALLLIESLRAASWVPVDHVVDEVGRMAATHARRWARDLVASPERLARRAVDVLVDNRLAERRSEPEPAVRLLPAAARYAPPPGSGGRQDGLW